MNKVKSNKSALCLAGLLILSALSGNIFGQQSFPQSGKKFFQDLAGKTNLLESDAISQNAHPRFFPDAKTFSDADVIPPGKKQTSAYTRPNADQRFKKYVSRTIGGYALIGDVVSAGYSQIVDTPEEWENNSKGFGRRLASTFGKSVIRETVIYGLDESFKVDSNFYKSGKKGFNDRLKNAFLSTFTARKSDGKRVIGIPRIAGAYTSAIIANQYWYPSRYNYKNGFSSGTISLGVSVGINFLREFF